MLNNKEKLSLITSSVRSAYNIRT